MNNIHMISAFIFIILSSEYLPVELDRHTQKKEKGKETRKHMIFSTEKKNNDKKK